MQPFRVDVPQAELDSLRARLTGTRWPPEPPEDRWRGGVPPAYLRELIEYWATGYDWRRQESQLNRIPQFTTDIDGQRIHIAEPDPAELAQLTGAEQERVSASLRRRARAQAEEMGFGMVQSTRPQTLAYGLTDSPVGQLAWIVEKFKEWTDCVEVPEEAVDRDQMLTNVMLYWLTRTAASSAGLYYETAHSADGWAIALRPSTVPTGVAVFPRDTSLAVRHLAERTDNVVHWSQPERGGHFPAMEVPDVLVDDIRAFFRRFR
jgi:pimeloyl-ACP methyl ester carboxylesterase